jgi:hypothetical protein
MATEQPGQTASPILNNEFKNLLPPLSDEERTELEDAIIRDGCRDAILVWSEHNIIVDGHNRYEICTSRGVRFETKQMPFKSEDEVKEWIITNQLARRNISRFAKVELASKLADLHLAAQARANMATGRGKRVVVPIDIRNEIARLAGVGHNTVSFVKKIKDGGVPELIEAARGDQVSVATAVQICKFDEADQRTLIKSLGVTDENIAREINALRKKREKEAREAVLDAQRDTDTRKAVGELSDAVEWLRRMPNRGADLLLTDPPYSTDIEDIKAFVDSWVLLALSKVKLTGSAYIFIGAYPKEEAAYLNALLSQDLFELQTLVWSYRNTIGPAPSKFYKQNWHMILFLRGPEAPPLQAPNLLEQFSVQLVNAPDGRLGNRFHHWQKPYDLAEMFIRHASQEGDLVIDPFMCTGTHILAAADRGRTAKGCDNDPEVLAIAEDRGCKIIW